jgi:caa(3)-type oxidase subunit IV
MDARLSRAIKAPLFAFAALLALLATTTTYALSPAPGKTIAAAVIAAAKTSIIALIYMRLARASALTRFAAAAGPAWLLILFVLSGIDFSAR